MKSNINIFTYLRDDAKLFTVLDKFYKYTKIETYDEFLEIVSASKHNAMYMCIVDVDRLKGKKFSHFKKDLLNKKHIFVTAYGDKISTVLKSKLYGLEIRGVIEDSSKNQKVILDHIITQANLRMHTLDNRFIKSFLSFYDIYKINKEINYLLAFLSYKYNINVTNISDIHLVFISLFGAFKMGVFQKVAKILEIMFESPAINKLYNSYNDPKTFEELVIVILLKLFESEDQNIKKEIVNIDFDKFQILYDEKNNLLDSPLDGVKLFEEISYIYRSKSIIITSYQDVNYLWELLETAILEDCIVTICNLLIYAIARVDYIKVSIDVDKITSQAKINIEIFGASNEILKEYIDTKISTNRLSIELFEDNKVILKTIKEDVKELVETKCFNKDKISAKEFLKEFILEQYLLDDLNDFESDIRNELYAQESITQEMLIAITNTLDRYERILNETMEFKEIAYSIHLLSALLKELSLETFNGAKIGVLKIYIQGLIDDLISWKTYIFIEQNTPDIHYLDASLLENCSIIEKFISSDIEDESVEDESELEFF